MIRVSRLAGAVRLVPAFAVAFGCACVLAAQTLPQAGAPHVPAARAELKNANGETVGTVQLMEVANGVLLHGAIVGLPPGPHGFHIHAVGKCEPPDFKSAGGHFNPDAHSHGFADPKGPHAGDLPNLYVPMNGRLEFDAQAKGVTLAAGPNGLFGPDGTSLVIHESADDYKTNPAGNAGARIACGVIVK